ncbi:MAG: hypothetical protein ACRD4C_07605 [Candidatus Acidiferrales bacterium]
MGTLPEYELATGGMAGAEMVEELEPPVEGPLAGPDAGPCARIETAPSGIKKAAIKIRTRHRRLKDVSS